MKKLCVEQTSECISQLGIANSSARLLPANTVVLSRTAVRGLCARLGKPMATQPGLRGIPVRTGSAARVLACRCFATCSGNGGASSREAALPTRPSTCTVFKRLKILLPPPKEQAAIAEVGESFDERIAAEVRYLEQLRQTKQGLAQSLLSGRVRVDAGKTQRRARQWRSKESVDMASDFKWDEVHLSEDPADALLRQLGYDFVAAEVLDGERESLAEPVLVKRLDAALRRLNPWLSDDNVKKAVRAITHASATSLIEANEKLHTTLTYGISLEQDLGTGKKGQTVRFFDFDNPRTTTSSSRASSGCVGAKKNIIPDIVCS